MAVSGEQATKARYVDYQSNKLAALVKDVKEDNIKRGLSHEKIIDYYGEPVLVKEKNGNTIFLYRDTVRFFPEEKVYLYFDSEGKLIDYMLEETLPAEEVINPE